MRYSKRISISQLTSAGQTARRLVWVLVALAIIGSWAGSVWSHDDTGLAETHAVAEPITGGRSPWLALTVVDDASRRSLPARF